MTWTDRPEIYLTGAQLLRLYILYQLAAGHTNLHMIVIALALAFQRRHRQDEALRHLKAGRIRRGLSQTTPIFTFCISSAHVNRCALPVRLELLQAAPPRCSLEASMIGEALSLCSHLVSVRQPCLSCGVGRLTQQSQAQPHNKVGVV